MVIEIAGWVFTATLEFESALIDTLAVLEDSDEHGRLAACQRIAEALVPFRTMSDDDVSLR
jgi:hypothetical protein